METERTPRDQNQDADEQSTHQPGSGRRRTETGAAKFIHYLHLPLVSLAAFASLSCGTLLPRWRPKFLVEELDWQVTEH